LTGARDFKSHRCNGYDTAALSLRHKLRITSLCWAKLDMSRNSNNAQGRRKRADFPGSAVGGGNTKLSMICVKLFGCSNIDAQHQARAAA
jgi:hypothetical protein